MKTIFTLTCANKECENFQIPVDLSDSEKVVDGKPEGWEENFVKRLLSTCDKCRLPATMLIKHGQRVFTNREHLGEYLRSAQKEQSLLKRLSEAGLLSGEEKERFNELISELDFRFCPCCGAEENLSKRVEEN